MATLKDLDFPVEKQEIFDKRGKSIPHRRAIVRTDTGEALAIVSPYYQLKTHVDTLGPIIARLGKAWEVTKVKVESDGARSYVKMVNTQQSVKVDGHDISPLLTLSNSYDRTKKLGANVGFFRFECSNGLVVPLEGFPSMKFKTSHFGNVQDKFDDLLKRIGMFTENVPALVAQYSQLTDKVVSAQKAQDVLREILGENKLKQVLWYWEGHGKGLNGNPTAWNLYNAVSEYLSNDYVGQEHLSNEYNTRALRALIDLK